jgi:hypothetical protein
MVGPYRLLDDRPRGLEGLEGRAGKHYAASARPASLSLAGEMSPCISILKTFFMKVRTLSR